MSASFSEIRATQAAYFLIDINQGRINSQKLLHLLYMADRESLKQYGSSITRDDYFADINGMFPLNTYRMLYAKISEENFSYYWRKYITRDELDNVSILKQLNPGDDYLSPVNTDVLIRTAKEYYDLTPNEMEIRCKSLPEYQKNFKVIFPVSTLDVLTGTGMSQEQSKDIHDHIESMKEMDKLFGIDAMEKRELEAVKKEFNQREELIRQNMQEWRELNKK